MTPRLPIEVIEHIISHLQLGVYHWRSQRDLAACSLVCKAWLPTARHLFLSAAQVAAFKLDAFLMLMGSPHSTLGHHIYHLQIYGSGSWDRSFYPKLANLKRLRSLSLFGIKPNINFAQLLFVQGVTYLRLSHLSMECPVELATLLSTMPSLQEFHLVSIFFRKQEEEELSASMYSPNLASLRDISIFSSRKSRVIYEWISKISLPSLRALHLFPAHSNQDAVQRIFQSHSSTLEQLSVSSHISWDLGNLRHLHLISIKTTFFSPHDATEDYLLPILTNLVSSLEGLVFTVVRDFVLERESVDWSGLTRVLDCSRFDGLKQLSFQAFDPEAISLLRAKKFIQSKLHKWHERGILEIVRIQRPDHYTPDHVCRVGCSMTRRLSE